MTETFLVSHDQERKRVLAIVEVQKLPFTVKLSEGVDRSAAQNRLAHLWFREVAEQTGATPDEVRAECKLTLGIPIRRMDDDEYRELYDEIFKPLKLAQKLALMTEPFEWGVTRDMTTKQMARFLDAMWSRFAVEMGLRLSEPEPAVGSLPSHVKETA